MEENDLDPRIGSTVNTTAKDTVNLSLEPLLGNSTEAIFENIDEKHETDKVIRMPENENDEEADLHRELESQEFIHSVRGGGQLQTMMLETEKMYADKFCSKNLVQAQAELLSKKQVGPRSPQCFRWPFSACHHYFYASEYVTIITG